MKIWSVTKNWNFQLSAVNEPWIAEHIFRMDKFEIQYLVASTLHE